MHPATPNRTLKGLLNTADAGLRSPANLTAAAIRGALTLAVLFALLLIAARPSQAQTETVLYNFTGGSDGAYPEFNLTSDGKGNFFGTTPNGGLGYGVVFELSPNGGGGWNETVLYSFSGGADGAYPESYVMLDGEGNLYATTESGGAYQWGTVFELSPVGASWTETVLHNFSGVDGDCGQPTAGLIMDKAGNLFGETSDCKGGLKGTVFELSRAGGWTETVIYSGLDNAYFHGLTMDAAGNIFGTSEGTVFELSPNGAGGWDATRIFRGAHRANGVPALDLAGNVYGTTWRGGANSVGMVYKLSLGKKGWTEKTLYSFKGGSDGSYPYAGVVLDAAGNIYGTTGYGGQSGYGSVFELVAPVGKGSYQEKVLWSFNGTDGELPDGSVILDDAGNLYGTTQVGGSTWQGGGGTSGYGVVFEVTR